MGILGGSFPSQTENFPAGMTVGYEVFDRIAGTVTASRDEHKQFRSASVVKLLIALDYLTSHGPGYGIPAGDRALLESMLRASNDDAASTLWARDGWEQIVRRMVGLIGLTDTAPPAKRGMWGYTAISAADVVRTYRYILDKANPSFRNFVMSNLRQSVKCAADGFDQSFGIPAAAPGPHAVKQGWSGFGSPGHGDQCVPGRIRAELRSAVGAADGVAGTAESPGLASAPGLDLTSRAMHTTGTIGTNDSKIVVVLTLEPTGISWKDSATRITNVTRTLVWPFIHLTKVTPTRVRP